MIALSTKVCLLGDFAVGKTSLVRRFVHNLFDDKYLSTIGVKVSRKVVVVPRVDDVIELTIMLWDLAGNEEFDSIRASYLRGTTGALLVCDLTRAETLESLRRYVDDLRAVSPAAKLLVAGNKSDLKEQRQISDDQLEAFASVVSAPISLTSAKTGVGVEDAFRDLGRLIARC